MSSAKPPTSCIKTVSPGRIEGKARWWAMMSAWMQHGPATSFKKIRKNGNKNIEPVGLTVAFMRKTLKESIYNSLKRTSIKGSNSTPSPMNKSALSNQYDLFITSSCI